MGEEAPIRHRCWRSAWLVSPNVGTIGTVLDELTGKRSPLRIPTGCPGTGRDPLPGHTWLLVACDQTRIELYSLAARRWHSVMVAPSCSHSTAGPGSSCDPQAVGSDWIEYDEGSLHLGDVFVFQNLATGALRRDPTGPRTVPNLDSPTLAQRTCRPVRVPPRGSLAIAGRFALASSPAGQFLEQCGKTLHRSEDDFATFRGDRSLSRGSDRHVYLPGQTHDGKLALWSAAVHALQGP